MQDSLLIEVRTTILWDSVTVKPNTDGSFIMMLKERQSNDLVQLDTFQVTPDQDRINVDWSIESGQYYIVAKDINTNGLFRENLASNPFPYDDNKFVKILGNGSGDTTNYNYYYDWKLETPNPSILMIGASGGVYFTDDAINVGAQPTWYFVSHPGGTNVTSITNTDDGTFYFGTQIGDIYRLDGLADANYWKIQKDSCFQNIQACEVTIGQNSCSGISLNQISNNASFEGSSRYVTGMDANPHNKEQLVVTLGNYGNSEYVYIADNAASVSGGTSANFSSIQGDLPPMPVYDPLVEFYENDANAVEQLFVGTEMGVWSTDRASSNNVAWQDESSTSNKSGIQGMPRVPSFSVREKPLRDRDCKVIYVGTHGRGIFRSISIAEKQNLNCDLSIPELSSTSTQEDENFTENSSVKDLSFYPNPVTDQAIVEYKLDDVKEAKLHVVDLLGQTVKTFNLQGTQNTKQKATLDFTDISGGTYLLSIDAQGNITHTSKIVVSK